MVRMAMQGSVIKTVTTKYLNSYQRYSVLVMGR